MPNSFFYFVPDKNSVTPSDYAALGLSYAFERGVDCRQAEDSPSRQRGVVIAQQDSYEDGQFGYYPNQQTWRQIPGSPVWAGYYNAQRPTVDDLLRSKPLDGHSITLDDGQRWQVPLARSYREKATEEELEIFWSVALPQRLDLAADGKWVTGAITPRYAALWELAESWVRLRDDAATQEDKERFTYQGQIDGAVCALQANYRVGRIEMAMLGCLNDSLAVSVLDLLIDRENLTAMVKKKLAMKIGKQLTQSAGSSSPAGQEAATRTTDQPLPTLPL